MGTAPSTIGGPLASPGDLSTESSVAEPVLLPVVDGDVTEGSLNAARALASGIDTTLVVLNVVCRPEQTPLSLSPREEKRYQRQLRDVRTTLTDADESRSVHEAVHVGRHLVHVLNSAVEKYDVSVVVADTSWTTARFSPLFPTSLETFVRKIRCPVVVPSGRPLPNPVPSILVPVAGGPHFGTAVDVAHAIARAYDAHIELLHVLTSTDSTARQAADTYLAAGQERLRSFDDVDTWLLEAEDVATAIADQSQYYEGTVIGAPQTSRLRRLVFGSTARSIRTSAENSVLTVWK